MTNRQLRLSVTLFVLGVGLASGCKKDTETEHTQVRMTCSKNLWCGLVILAKEQGFFAEEGIAAELEYVQAAKFSMDALVSSSTDVAGVVEVNVSYLGFTGNQDVRVIGTIVQARDGAVVGRRSMGITGPGDLKGKRVGILRGTTSQIFADRFLSKHGLKSSDVEVSNLQPIAIQTAIVERSVAAGSVWEPFVHNVAKQLGDDAIVFADPDVYVGTMNLAVRADWAAGHEREIAGVLRALRKAKAFTEQHKGEAQAMLAKVINLDPSVVEAIWDNYRFDVDLDAPRLTSEMKREGEWIVETQPGFEHKAVPDYSRYVTDSYVGR